MRAATQGVATPCSTMEGLIPGWESQARRWRHLVGALKTYLAATRPGEPRRNNAIVSDALMLLSRGDIPMDPTAMPAPAELIECVELWRQDLGTHSRPKRSR